MADLAIINGDGTITTILEGIQEWNLDKPIARAWFESKVTEAMQRHVTFAPEVSGDEEIR